MAIRYADLGLDKRLRDIVFAGSHDAGITSGGANAQTQDRDIQRQARAGVRLFDLRIMAGTSGGTKQLMAYHAGGGVVKTNKKGTLADIGAKRKFEHSHLTVGNFGLGLQGMLNDAKAFVTSTDSTSEFLILKFDKCTNWELIAEVCVATLGASIYTGAGDLNRKTLDELKGKVIVLFSEKGLEVVRSDYSAADGILGFRNLYSKEGGPKAYDANYDGLQYFGKGGTSVNPVTMKWSHHGKIAENVQKQADIMSRMANSMSSHSSDVLGMVYWTSTGLSENIEDRNAKMWTDDGKDSLRALWLGGLRESIQARSDAKRIKTTSYASGTWLKAFIPNIVMIDFASRDKCRTIYKLNRLAATELTRMFADEKKLVGA